MIDYDSIAEIYDLYVTADYDVAFFVAEAAAAAGPVLELTTGTGRLSLPLVEAGVELTCVDRSQGMVDVLSRKLAERGLHAELCCADVCGLSLPARFVLAILPFQSFMEIVGEGSQRAALAAVSGCLVPGGRFICTLHNPAVRRSGRGRSCVVTAWRRSVGPVATGRCRSRRGRTAGGGDPASRLVRSRAPLTGRGGWRTRRGRGCGTCGGTRSG